MCGICGRASGTAESAEGFDVHRLAAMRDSMTHRGPDDAGSYLAPGIALGVRRLAVIDLTAHGHMPMQSTDGRFRIVHNGEIYNFPALRQPLEANGHMFQSHTDTETLLALYAEHGPAMLSLLNGMFAFAIWDEREQSLFIARDRLGVKPLYYGLHEGAFYFASEVKALFAAGLPFAIDPDIWPELLYFRYTAGERTPFVGIRRLLPGHYLTWRRGELRVTRWWHLAERAQALREQLPADAAAWFGQTFDDAVALRRISDVPLGVLLSGGLDSGSVAAALAAQAGAATAGGRLNSFTVGFAEAGYDESHLAAQVAGRWGLEEHCLRIAPEDLPGQWARAAWLNDEPPAHGADAHLLSIALHAKPRVTVLLSGEGADETLGGYVRYRPLRYAALFGLARRALSFSSLLPIPGRLGGRLAKLKRLVGLGGARQAVLFNACDVLPGDLPGVPGLADGLYRQQVLDEAAVLYPGEPLRQAMYLDQHTFLRSILDRNDRMTMGASIECRVPFLDYRLVEMLAALPTRRLIDGRSSKHLLRQSIGARLPDDVLRHHKWGFGVPWSAYLRQIEAFREIVHGLPDLHFLPLDRAWLRGAVADFMGGGNQHAALMHQLAMLSLWHTTITRHMAEQPVWTA